MAADAHHGGAVSAPHWMGAGEAVHAFAARRLSPVELLEALLARIDTLDPALHVFIRRDDAAARAAARAAEAEYAAGGTVRPLLGVPVGIKDIIDVGGLPTTCHSRVRIDHMAAIDAACVARLRAAGAIIIGKLATHEFAIGGPSFDLPFPPARNPWNTAHHPGGSSSGSGAGLAAGLFPLALGTDTAGSIRHPASACGVVGLKPTYGLVSRRGVFPLSFSLDHVGPMSRGVADTALLLEAMAGHDPADPGSAAGAGWRAGEGLEAGVRGLRIGFVRHFHQRDMEADPEVAAALEVVARTLAADGAIVSDVTLPELGEFAAVNRAILHAESWSIHAPWLRARPGDYGQLGRQRLMAGAFQPAGDLVAAQRRRGQMIADVEAALAKVDVLMAASSMDPPSLIEDAAATARTYPRQARTPFNVTGHPALAMLSAVSRAGLPLSVQFVGRYFDEATLLRVARGWEQAGATMEKHPPL